MKVCVLGAGYVGLVVGVCLANIGHTVCCVDTDQQKISNLHHGILPIYEPGLDRMVLRNVAESRLTFSVDSGSEIAKATIIYIAVGTPSAEDGSADLQYVRMVAEQIAQHASSNSIVVIKSTVPVGTADMVRQILHGSNVVDVVSNPEFLREGMAIVDFENPDRIVIGCQNDFAKTQMEQLYASFVEAGYPVFFMDNRSAEITKYASNALLATKISFANELARLCEAAGADIDSVRLGTGADSRIGSKFLYAGVGYGGSCFPKDVKALIHMANQHGVVFQIAEAVEKVNAEQKVILLPKIYADLGDASASDGLLQGKKIAVWGLAFKPETDDIREAPSLYMIKELLQQGASVHVTDPEAMTNVQAVFGNKIQYGTDIYKVVEEADALIVLTEWKHYFTPQWDVVAQLMKGKFVYDGRNIYTPSDVKEHQLVYRGIGRGVV